jgi:hypothetical protein
VGVLVLASRTVLTVAVPAATPVSVAAVPVMLTELCLQIAQKAWVYFYVPSAGAVTLPTGLTLRARCHAGIHLS